MVNVLNVENKKTLFAGTFVLIVFIAASFYIGNVLNLNSNYKENIVSEVNHVLRIGNVSVRVDIADTPALQEQGLSGRQLLLEDQGMYFIFNHPGIYPFWMKEMNFPIDIIWIGEHMSVIDITQDALPSSFPQTFVSRVPALYVLEVQAGFAERHGVKIGDQVLLDP
jgi:uncharacterized membrane protein (UPF0127 family)